MAEAILNREGIGKLFVDLCELANRFSGQIGASKELGPNWPQHRQKCGPMVKIVSQSDDDLSDASANS